MRIVIVNCFVAGNAYIYKDAFGNYYAKGIYSNEFFRRYLKVFDDIIFTAKVKYLDDVDLGSYELLTSEHITFVELSAFKGFRGLRKKIFQVWTAIADHSKMANCYIFRMTQLESIIAFCSRNRQVPYALEVVNDPEKMTYYPVVVRKACGTLLRRMLEHADAVSYVTQYALQKCYPYRNNAGFSTYYSSVSIDPNEIRVPKDYPCKPAPLKIIHVSNIVNGNLKGHYSLLRITEKLVASGLEVQVHFVGDGDEVIKLKNECVKLGIKEYVTWKGRVDDRKELFDYMASCDIFVYPSHFPEGLPRVLVEACACGLPCLSSDQGGSSELIRSEYIFDKEDESGFIKKIIELVNDPAQLEIMSKENLKVAKAYTSAILDSRRTQLYTYLKRKAQET